MKNKTKILLNIICLCMSIVAIVIGVFSINQSKLNINGSLGYVRTRNAYLATNWSAVVFSSSNKSVPLIEEDGTSSTYADLSKSNINSIAFVKKLSFNTSVQGLSIGASTLDGTVHTETLPDDVADIQAYAKTNGGNYDVYIYSPGIIYAPTDCNQMLSQWGITSIDLSNFDTSNVENMKYMFMACYNLTSIDLSRFNTSKVKDMNGFIQYSSKLTSLDLSSFDTSNVVDMSYMITDCNNIKSLNLSNFNTSKVSGMIQMFASNSKLETIYVSNNWNTASVTSSDRMFSGCTKLKGGAGTLYDDSHTDKTYARIDGGISSPGYFTEK